MPDTNVASAAETQHDKLLPIDTVLSAKGKIEDERAAGGRLGVTPAGIARYPLRRCGDLASTTAPSLSRASCVRE